MIILLKWLEIKLTKHLILELSILYPKFYLKVCEDMKIPQSTPSRFPAVPYHVVGSLLILNVIIVLLAAIILF